MQNGNIPKFSHENYFTITDAPESLQYNFPPTEIDRTEEDRYVQSDPTTLNTFLYPSNIDRREYQFTISQTCFHYNTLVCLPTGAGKTLIAAVAIMNFHRWFPKGKIIFMATTRNLVNQQIDACTSFTNIPENEITIIMGTTLKNRKDIWNKHKVFFCTPQIVNNDIEKKRLDPTEIVLLIFDEAHHAHGNYAYSMVVRKVAEKTSQFRIIGLSATPGNNIESIQSVIYNLMISKIIYKDDNDPDISKYQHETNTEVISMPLGSDEQLLLKFLSECISMIAEPLQVKGYLRTSAPENLTKGVVYMSMKGFQESSLTEFSRDKYIIINSFGLLLSLATFHEKLIKYGSGILNDSIKDFLKNKKETEQKKRLVNSRSFQALIKNSERAKNIIHPKLARLAIILHDFYTNHPDSKSIVFTQFRAVAYEIDNHLKRIPLVKSSIFIGKAKTSSNDGLDDATQLEVVSSFRKGSINCIVATSVGEEGLDIGEVDLIVCYDTSASPLKTVQRIGRTGRKRAGKVIFLMTEGYEEKFLERANNTKTNIKSKLTTELSKFVLYKPQKPNIPLPEDLRVINLRCVHEVNNKSITINNDNCKSPFLQKNECHVLECCFGPNLKYHKIKLGLQRVLNDGICLISHSSESNILSAIHSQNHSRKELIIKNLIDNLSDDEENNTELKSNPFSVKNNSDSSESETNTPCIPLYMHIQNNENKFLSDDEDVDEKKNNSTFLSDDDDISFSSNTNENSKKLSFLDDEDDEDINIEETNSKPLNDALFEKKKVNEIFLDDSDCDFDIP